MYKKLAFGVLVILVIVVIVILATTKKTKVVPKKPQVNMEEMKYGSTPLQMEEFADRQFEHRNGEEPVLNPFDHPPPEDAMEEMSNFETLNGDDFDTFQRDRINMTDSNRYE